MTHSGDEPWDDMNETGISWTTTREKPLVLDVSGTKLHVWAEHHECSGTVQWLVSAATQRTAASGRRRRDAKRRRRLARRAAATAGQPMAKADACAAGPRSRDLAQARAERVPRCSRHCSRSVDHSRAVDRTALALS